MARSGVCPFCNKKAPGDDHRRCYFQGVQDGLWKTSEEWLEACRDYRNRVHRPVAIQSIQALACCTEEDAQDAYDDCDGNVEDAIEVLLQAPPCEGDRYIPQQLSIDDGLSDEQRERCLRARKVCDTINAAQTSAYRSAKQAAETAESVSAAARVLAESASAAPRESPSAAPSE